MIENTSSQSRVEALAEAFVGRVRKGERPSISDYTRRNPELADEIEEIFPALLAIEQAKDDFQDLAQEKLPAPVAPSVSTLGDFRIIREIGRGGMGIVYEAEQVSLGRRVALKVLAGSLLNDSRNRKRFAREARAAAGLHHTNIVPVFGVGEQDDVAYYVMQLIRGLGLDDILKELDQHHQQEDKTPELRPQLVMADRADADEQPMSATSIAGMLISGRFEQTMLFRPEASEDAVAGDSDAGLPEMASARALVALTDTRTGQLSGTGPQSPTYALPGQSASTSPVQSRQAYWKSVAAIGVQVAEALAYAHEQGICHRDIKPANLLLDTHGTAWVTDFGLAKATDQQNLTHTGDVIGTLRYMAPEQFDGLADSRSDVYSLGLTLYELLALRPAFDQTDRQQLLKAVTAEAPPRLRSLDPQIPGDLATVVQKAIEREPSLRYQTAGELADDLRRFLSDEPIQARRVSVPARLRRWFRRNPAVARLTTAIALLLMTTAVVASVSAARFEKLADRRTRLADDLQTALGTAERNLTRANAEHLRAKENLNLAFQALDEVFLDTIGSVKLLGEPATEGESFATRAEPVLSTFEAELLRRWRFFYQEFIRQNEDAPGNALRTAQSYHRVGLIQAGLTEYTAARASLRAAISGFENLIKQEPANQDYWRNLASAHLDLGHICEEYPETLAQFERAFDAYSTGLAIDPTNSALRVSRGRCRLLAGSPHTEALDDFETALGEDPQNVRALEQCIDIYAFRNRRWRNVEKAREYSDRLLAINPDNAWGLRVKAEYSEDKQDRDEYLHRWMALTPPDPRAYIRHARVAVSDGDIPAAIVSLNVAAAAPTNIPGWILSECARARIHTGQLDRALDEILRAAKLDQSSAYIRGGVGEVYSARHEYPESLVAFNTAIDMLEAKNRRDSYFYILRARVHWNLKQYDKAIDDLEHASIHRAEPDVLFKIRPEDVAQTADDTVIARYLKLLDTEMTEHPTARDRFERYRARLLAHRESSDQQAPVD